MDYRQYDPAIGRFNSMDVLSELAFSITPYRFAYNNPIYFSDPTGLFETRKEAREYRREHNITGSIVKENDGSFAINDKNNAISYFKPPEGVEVSTMGSDGVATSAYGPNAFERLFSALKNAWDLWTKVENIESVAKDGNVSKGTIEVQNVEPVKIKVPLYHYGVDDTPGNRPSVGRKGHHDTVVKASERTVIEAINDMNYKKQQGKANSLANEQGYN
ncbi:RHS repeat-associated core domain-containing protein [Flavobacterium sp. PL02]|uniref:RHS repeat-associated core domain-containing protein n=1 Tax=Flavobacterium sp. PL02 TaxID=3088354 RepID=UPI002B234682|nr:RHS repeat-associated core domain-containing protein [Flavobacterium sp. PL02]MEA9412714.1 RHS repeat-associated core domain-containing protein [Flavobacterium sp. PL02]